MQENFLHYIWKYKKFQCHNLKTTSGKELVISSVGQHNFNSGPDFFNSQLKIDEQLWAGNVEIHLKSSDWFLHNHEQDKSYDNVILHVVWHHDTEVFRKNNTVIPTLQLKDYIAPKLLNNYQKLFSKTPKWINCENEFPTFDKFVLDNWLERLYFERLERKAKTVDNLLKASKNDWEAVLFKMLAKNFGLNVNGDAFFSLAQSIEFSIVRKTQSNQTSLEALLLGQAGLLEERFEDAYYLTLLKEYEFLKQKLGLKNNQAISPQFFRLRPHNFPTIRLSQLAELYHKHQNLFSRLVSLNTLEQFYELFNVQTSAYWKTHYTFHKKSKPITKKISKAFVDLIVINTIIPLQFCYAKHRGEDINAGLVDIANQIKTEKNRVVDAFNALKKVSNTSLESQALIQLKLEYCDKNQCLQCALGNQLLSQ